MARKSAAAQCAAQMAAQRSVHALPGSVMQAGAGVMAKAQMDDMLARVQEGLAAGLGVDKVLCYARLPLARALRCGLA